METTCLTLAHASGGVSVVVISTLVGNGLSRRRPAAAMTISFKTVKVSMSIDSTCLVEIYVLLTLQIQDSME